MSGGHLVGVAALLLAGVGAGVAAGRLFDPSEPGVGAATPGEIFFDALLRHPERRLDSLRALNVAALRPDAAPRDILLLGLNFLWLAAENERDPVTGFNHAVLARHWLRRAEELLPLDSRIPSWRWAAEWAIADAERDAPGAEAARATLKGLATNDPCFHAVAFGIISFEAPPESEAFRDAHRAMEASFRCGDTASAQDRPRWPHNVHAFLVALADFRLKAGDLRGAEDALVIAEARPGFERWKLRRLVDDRLANLGERQALFENADPGDDPAFVFERGGPVSCTGCHGE